MTTALGLAGLGLALLPAANPTRSRLERLAAGRPGLRPTVVRRPRRIGWPRSDRWAVLAVAIGGFAIGPLPGLLAALAGWVAFRAVRAVLADRARDASRAELLDVVAALIDEHEAGSLTGAAFAAAASVSTRYRAVLTEAARSAASGAEPEPALGADPALSSVAVASALAQRTGASLAQVLTGVRADLTAERATRRAVAAAVGGPRTSALMVAGLPAIGLAMGSAMGARPLHILLHTPVGLAVLTIGVGLDLAGLLWTLALTRQPAR